MADDDARAEAEREYPHTGMGGYLARDAFEAGAAWQASRTPVVADERHASVPGVDQDDPTHPDPRWCNVCGEPANAPQHAAPVVADRESLVNEIAGLRAGMALALRTLDQWADIVAAGWTLRQHLADPTRALPAAAPVVADATPIRQTALYALVRDHTARTREYSQDDHVFGCWGCDWTGDSSGHAVHVAEVLRSSGFDRPAPVVADRETPPVDRAALSAGIGALLERARHEVYHTEFLPPNERFIPAATVVDLLALIDGFIEVLAAAPVAADADEFRAALVAIRDGDGPGFVREFARDALLRGES